MTITPDTFSRDANSVPITTLGITATKSITYVAGTTGATGATTLFTVTGCVAVRVFGVCSTLLEETGATATLEIGIAGNTAALIVQTTGTAIDANEVWIDTAPATIEALPAFSIIGAGQDIIQTIAGNTVSAGVLTYYCVWAPISSDGNVVAA